MNYTKAQKISLKQDPEISESWVQMIKDLCTYLGTNRK